MEKSETICYKRRPVRIGVGVEAGVSGAQGGGEVELGEIFFWRVRHGPSHRGGFW